VVYNIFGDPTSNAPVFNRYAVLLGIEAATVPNAPAAFVLNETSGGVADEVDEWDVVGALHEDNPFSNGEESIDETKHTAAGFGVYAKTHKNQEETIEFTALETTLLTLGILYDASGVTDTAGVFEGKLKQRDPSKKYKVAFQRENADVIERRVSTKYAQISNITRAANSDRAEYTVSLTIYPNASHELYDYYLGPDAA
jgi:hypothetical protein